MDTLKPGPRDWAFSSDWESYRRQVLPANAGPVQVQECQRAFYAGGWAMLQTFFEVGAENVSVDDGAAVLEKLRDELQAFVRMPPECPACKLGRLFEAPAGGIGMRCDCCGFATAGGQG